MRSHLQSSSIEAYAVDGAVAYWHEGWPLVALFVLAFVVVFPIVRSALLTVVLGSLRLGYRSRWQGRLFRYAEELLPWSMLEVYLLASFVTYSRIATQLDIEIRLGGWCFAIAAVVLLIGEASLDRHRIWRAIHPDASLASGERTIGCDICNMVLPGSQAGNSCPRCARLLNERKPNAVNRTIAFTTAAFVLYVPAYLLPMTRTVQPGGFVHRTILDGIHELFDKGFWYLGVILFTASIAIPFLKLAGLTWFVLRVKFPCRTGLVLRTKAHRIIHRINHWSFVDPFIVALTAPLMSYPGIADVHTGPGALPFSLVVAFTMLASRFFDNRLMWDAAKANDA